MRFTTQYSQSHGNSIVFSCHFAAKVNINEVTCKINSAYHRKRAIKVVVKMILEGQTVNRDFLIKSKYCIGAKS